MTSPPELCKYSYKFYNQNFLFCLNKNGLFHFPTIRSCSVIQYSIVSIHIKPFSISHSRFICYQRLLSFFFSTDCTTRKLHTGNNIFRASPICRIHRDKHTYTQKRRHMKHVHILYCREWIEYNW